MTAFIITMLILIFIAIILEIVLTAMSITNKIEIIKKNKTDKQVEIAQREEKENKSKFDEGLENIMSYSVDGNNGFEEDK